MTDFLNKRVIFSTFYGGKTDSMTGTALRGMVVNNRREYMVEFVTPRGIKLRSWIPEDKLKLEEGQLP